MMLSFMSAINPRQWLANAARAPRTLSNDEVKRASLMLAAVALLLGGVLPETRAGYITTGYASTSVSVDYSTPFDRVISSSTGTNTALISQKLTDIYGDTTSVTALASTGLAGGPWGVVANATVRMDFSAFPSPGGAIPSTASADASLQDIMFLSRTDPSVVGRTLRFTFQATGSFLDTGSSFAQKSVFVDTGSVAFGRTLSIDASGGAKGWDTLQRSGGNAYIGTFHIDVPLFAANYISGVPGSVYFRMDSNAGTTAFGSGQKIVESGALDPLQFTSITLPDVGDVTPESLGVTVTFDSGLLSPNVAVPEPATLTLLGMGIAAMAGYGRRRRKVGGFVK